MNVPITPADLDALTAALAPLDDLAYPPDVSADDDGSYECPACGGEGRVEGVATAGGGTAGSTCADIQAYGIQCYGIGHGHIELEQALRLLYRHRHALLAAARERDALWKRNEGLIETLRRDTLVHRAEKAEKERDTLRAELIEARAVLIVVEWLTDDFGSYCPTCAAINKQDGHRPACPIAAALKEKT